MTGLVYLAIIALWVVFLIPWLGRHRDEQNGRKTADRYHRAMDTLARAGRTIRHPQDDDVAEQIDEAGTGDGAADHDESGRAALNLGEVWRTLVASVVPTAVGRRSTAVRRRRRVLLLLAVAVVGSVAGVVTGLLPSLVAIGTVGLLVAYLVVLVYQTTRAGNGPAAQRAGSAEADRYREATRRAQAQARGLLAPQQAEAQVATGWDAVPATLPTYVTKPKASKVPRVVDLTATGRGWTGEAMVQQVAAERRRSQEQAAELFEREMEVLRADPVQEVAELASPGEQPAYLRQQYRRAANG